MGDRSRARFAGPRAPCSRTPRFTGPAQAHWTKDEHMYAPAPVQPRVRLHARSHPRPQPRPTRLVVLDAPTRLARLPARGAPAIACATADHRLASRTAFGGRARGPRHTSGVPLTRRKRISRTDHCAPTLRHQQAWPAGHRPSRPRQAALPPTSTHGCTSRCTAPRGWPAEPVDDQQRWRLRAAPRLAATRLAVTCSPCSRTPGSPGRRNATDQRRSLSRAGSGATISSAAP